jgi:formate hydrogenlyase subunit 4
VLAENASWLFRVSPYLIFAATWVAASLVPTFRTGLLFSWSADLIVIIASWAVRASSSRGPDWMSAPASAASAPAAR